MKLRKLSHSLILAFSTVIVVLILVSGFLLCRHVSSLKAMAQDATSSSYSNILDYSLCGSLEYLFSSTLDPLYFSFLYSGGATADSDTGKLAYPSVVPFSLSIITLQDDPPFLAYTLSLAGARIISLFDDQMEGYMRTLQERIVIGDVRGLTEGAYFYYQLPPLSLTLDQTIRLTAMIGRNDSSPYSQNRDFLKKCRFILHYLWERKLITTQDYQLTAESFR